MRAVVMGRNYTSLLSMIRAAGRVGCDIIAVRTVHGLSQAQKNGKLKDATLIEKASKYVRQHYLVEEDQQELLRLLMEKCGIKGEKTILLPTDDFVASTIDLNQEALKDLFVFPHVQHRQGEVVRLMDKDVQKAMARKAGLEVVEGWVVQIKNGAYQIPEGIRYPVFTKPEISFLGNKRCMKKCSDEAELKAVIDMVMKERECPLLVEQYVEIEKEYGILGYSDEGETVIPGIVEKIAVGHGRHNGVTLIGEYSSLKKYGELKTGLKRFMMDVGFTGLFDIDLYAAKGKIYFNELNLRLGAFGYAAVRAGYNMPGMLIESLTGRRCVQDTDFTGDIKCISEKVNLDDFAEGYISWEQYKANRASVDYGFIEDEDDPKPFELFNSGIGMIRLKRSIKNLLGR